MTSVQKKSSSIGMMEGAYFVSRQGILSWLNSSLGTQYTKIEQTANGVAVCKLMSLLHPQCLNFAKVKQDAKQTYQMMANYKLLQTAFQKLKIDKVIDVERLVRGKQQDNLEFLQWVKAYYDRCVDAQGGVPPERAENLQAHVEQSKPVLVKSRQPLETKENRARPAARARAVQGSNRVADNEAPALRAEIAELKATIERLQANVTEVEQERDFYFGKLRDVEILCQTKEDGEPVGDEFVKDIVTVLYANEDGQPGDAEPVGELSEERSDVEVEDHYAEGDADEELLEEERTAQEGVAPGEDTAREEDAEPEEDIAPEEDAEPEEDIMPEGDAEPEGDIMPEGDAEPEGDIMPEGDAEPEGDIMPEGDAEPEGDIMPEGDAEPEGDIAPENDTEWTS